MKRQAQIFLVLSGVGALVYGLAFFSNRYLSTNISIDRILALSRHITETTDLPDREPGFLVTETLSNSDTPSKTQSKSDTLESQSRKPSDEYVKAETSSNPKNSSVISTKNARSQKYLIFVCNQRGLCGGWGDRQRGLVSTFALALVTGRQFGAIITKPCNVTRFYIPNEINWVIPDSQLKGKSTITLNDVDSRLKISRRLKTKDFNKEYPQDVVYIHTNVEYLGALQGSQLYRKALPVWAQGTRTRYFATGWTKLMTLSASLQRRLKAFLEKIDFSHRKHPLVCAHVRIGRSATIKTDSEVRGKISDLPVLWNFMDKWVKNGSHVFLATDNYEVRNLTRKRFGDMMHDSGGLIMHVDRQAKVPHACKGFESALLDQLILMRCDVLIRSHSVFGALPSFLRNRTDNLFSFLKGQIKDMHI